MFVVKAEGLCKEWNGRKLFENAHVEITEGEHIALMGRNGVGKTSLVHMLTGQIDIDCGTISRRSPASEWGWMEQYAEVEENVTLIDFVQAGDAELYAAKTALESLQRRLAGDVNGAGNVGEQPDAAHWERLIESYSAAQEQYERLGGYEWETRVQQCLRRLHLPSDGWSQRYSELSGGQKTRAQLTRLLVAQPRFLILDEPTNHLDGETLDWLEEWLRQYSGTVLFVSHDRYFLDRVAHAIYELTAAGTKRYKGGYSQFCEQRALEERTQMTLYKKQERERRDLLETIRQYKQWFQKAHSDAGERNPYLKKRANKSATRFKAKEKMLERLESEKVERPRGAPQAQISFDDAAFEARTLVQIEQMSFSYGERSIFRGLNFEVRRGERIAVTGMNGVGKSTLLRLLIGQLSPTKGSVKRHPGLKVGYFAQELDDLNTEETVLDSLLRLPHMSQSHARTILACFLFGKDDVFKPIGALSMGEKCRVAFVKLYFSEANLLVLDEPTNYLDIDTRERIEEALLEYPGTLMMVSHDRYLLQKLANRVVHIDEEGVRTFAGSYDEYLEQLNRGPINQVALERANRVRQLELQLAQYMGLDEPSTEEERTRLVEQIREAKALIDALRREGM